MYDCPGILRDESLGEVICTREGFHEGKHVSGFFWWYDSDERAFYADGRTTFDGGGVRDSQNGKPRFDLIRPERLPYQNQMLTRWARLLAQGANRYGDRNWEQMSDSDSLARFKSSAARHFEQWINGETDEDHAAAVLFNIQGAEYVRSRLTQEW